MSGRVYRETRWLCQIRPKGLAAARRLWHHAARSMLAAASPMEIWITIAALVMGLALAAAMAFLERRPRPDMIPRLVPTTPLMFAGILVAILAIVHLLNGFGIHTGR